MIYINYLQQAKNCRNKSLLNNSPKLEHKLVIHLFTLFLLLFLLLQQLNHKKMSKAMGQVSDFFYLLSVHVLFKLCLFLIGLIVVLDYSYSFIYLFIIIFFNSLHNYSDYCCCVHIWGSNLLLSSKEVQGKRFFFNLYFIGKPIIAFNSITFDGFLYI